MSLLHCEKCHHEWEGEKDSKCDWCGEDSYILKEKTALEEMIEGILCSDCGRVLNSQLICDECSKGKVKK